MTAAQVREVVDPADRGEHWHEGDPHILVVFDAGYDVTRLAYLLADLPVELLGRALGPGAVFPGSVAARRRGPRIRAWQGAQAGR